MKLSKELLDLLACPKCKSNIKITGKNTLTCASNKCGRNYKVEEDIPIML